MLNAYRAGKSGSQLKVREEHALEKWKKESPGSEEVTSLIQMARGDIERQQNFISQVNKWVRSCKKIGKPVVSEKISKLIKDSQETISAHKKFLRQMRWKF